MAHILRGAFPKGVPEKLLHTPSSVLVYARTTELIDQFATELAEAIDPEFAFIDVSDPEGDGSPEVARGDDLAARMHHFFRVEAADLLPDEAAANLAHWAIGRTREAQSAGDDVAELGWLAPALRELAESERDAREPAVVVVSRAERVVIRFARGADDARRLLGILQRKNRTVIASLLVRPFPAYAELFDYVFRLQPAEDGAPGRLRVTSERSPAAA